MRILAINGSARENGNTELLVDKIVEGLDQVTKVALRDKNILTIVDKRHAEGGFTPVDDDFESIILQMMDHDKIILGTPLYWYGMSSLMKIFIDRWSQALRSPNFDFKAGVKDKELYLVVTGGPSARRTGLPLIMQVQSTCDFMGMKLVDYILGNGGAPEGILQDERALFEASRLNKLFKVGVCSA